MNRISNIILLAVFVLIIFVLAGGAGIFYQKMQPVVPSQESLAAEQTVKVLSSKVIPSIVAYGDVTDINGRNITLSYSGDSATVKIIETVDVYSFSQPTDKKTNTPVQQKVSFDAIKKGDSLNIALRLLPDGTLEGQTVIILRSAAVQ